jgi:hypothetical protein
MLSGFRLFRSIRSIRCLSVFHKLFAPARAAVAVLGKRRDAGTNIVEIRIERV